MGKRGREEGRGDKGKKRKKREGFGLCGKRGECWRGGVS